MAYLSHENQEEITGYSYESTELSDNEIYKLRFELGDTDISGGELTAALSDGEYKYIIEEYGNKSFNHKKIKALEAIIAKLSYQVNFSVDGMRYDLGDKFDRWKIMLEDLKSNAVKPPTDLLGQNINELGQNFNANHYFHYDMKHNPRK